ncbi:NUDIX hydrolase [Runella sp.]|uniref:NUDIX hydrolase n=1 Tax=Runella sp. TaxID=1960881 RepID=UPI00286E539D|nr:NUDIX hydrolase [Runella sp.]
MAAALADLAAAILAAAVPEEIISNVEVRIENVESNNMKVRPSAIIVENNHVLLLRYSYSGNNVFALPGGNPDRGETLTQTLERELSEELGIEVELREDAFYGEVIVAEREDVLHCVFFAQIVGGIPILNPKETTALELVWQPLEILSRLNMYPNVGENIYRYLVLNSTSLGYIGRIDQPFFG